MKSEKAQADPKRDCHIMCKFKIYVRSNFCYTKWEQEDVVPTFDEYLEIGGVEVTMYSDMSRGFDVNAIEYYIKQYKLTKEETIIQLHKMVRDLDKTMTRRY
ncbi:predicted protein [Arabidopsis lyrata subsp. lyrata]|uniref:Predicted protein n=1 Tax=Arabidopsis lyrata subsp. lyrata TaxID=81972 RepID=D7MAB6_ARALL|nr:predicted protein [Arabidopsis lyrata subsp. lyrata]